MIDIITTAYNEEENIDIFVTEIDRVMNEINEDYRIIIVDDGCTDKTEEYSYRLQKKYPIKYVKLSRNFGKDIALSAGIDFADGDANIIIDSDMQDPPDVIKDFVAEWKNGYDVVYGVRKSRDGESFIKKKSAELFYSFINKISQTDIPKNTGDFRLVSKKVLVELKKMKEKTRFMKGILSWVGFKSKAVYFDRAARYAGETKWNYVKLWNFALSGIFAFSSVPLKVWGYIGILLSSISFFYITFILVRTTIFGIDLPGYASLLSVTLFFGGIQLLSIGIVGEYIARIYDEVKDRPLYIVDYTKEEKIK